LLLALVEEVGGQALTAIQPFLAIDGPIEREELTTSVGGLIATFREHTTLVRAVIEAAGYDEGIAEYWDAIIGRFVDAARKRLRAEGFGDAEAAATATSLVWMTERMCYQQVVRASTGLKDQAAVAGMSEVWWTVLRAAQTAGAPSE
jgi:TetR/AcrR family transcriptional regulator, ethionamide resistance regulator